jgi:hypothetical protein
MNDAQRLVSNHGLPLRPDFSQHSRPRLRHKGDLDALRRLAIEAGPASIEYAQWLSVLQNNEDEGLADVDAFNGAIPMSVADQEADLQRVHRQTQQYWSGTVHPALHQVVNGQGIPLSQLPVEEAHQMAALLAADGYREAAQRLTDAISFSTSTSMGVQWIEPEEDNTLVVASDQRSADVDAYTAWRAAQGQRQGIQALQIQGRDADAALYAGITSPDGLTYEAASDWTRSDD